MAADWIALGGAIAKAIAKGWLHDQPTADAVGSTLIDYVESSVQDRRQARAVTRHLERVGDRIAAELEDYFHLEFVGSGGAKRGLPPNEQAAAISGVIDALAASVIDYDALVATNFDEATLARQLCASRDRLGLSEAGIRLYELLAKECAVYVVGATMAMPDFTARAAVTLLRREAESFAAVDEAISRIPKNVASQLGIEDAQRFELDYRRNMVRRLDSLSLYGVDDDRAQAPYPLTVAYLELTLARQDTAGSHVVSMRVDRALSEGRRFIITGDAGSGKTTVLQWLAVQACRSSFEGHLEHWNDRVPFFIRLRAYSEAALPQPSAFLDTTTPVLADGMPNGWVTERLKVGRALVLIDGLDELQADRRPDTIAWLDELCTTYPRAAFVLTSRPPALSSLQVPADLGFAVRVLEPMSAPDILAFVANWHRAAARTAIDAEDAQTGVAMQSRIVATIRDVPTLRALAGNPLLCALLCALNRARRGLVAQGRIEIYATALSMLLRRRDTLRGIATSAKDLEETESLVILQDLAYWMLRNEQPQVTRDGALGRIGKRLESLPHVGLGADEVYGFLLERTGVLREPADGQLDFIHLSFQEYLAAGEVVAQDDVGALVQRVRRQQWLEVAVNVAALANERQREALVEPLVADDAHPRLHLLALACLGVSTSLSAALVAAVKARGTALVPPRSPDEARALAAAGPIALTFLSAVETTAVDDATAKATVRAIASVGGDDALRALSAWRFDRRPAVQQEIIDAWPAFALDQYVDDVLADLVPDAASPPTLTVGPAQMPYVARLPWVRSIVCEAGGSDVGVPVLPESVAELTIRSAASESIAGLHAGQGLRILRVEHCPALVSLCPRAELPNLEEVYLRDLPALESLAALRSVASLVTLRLVQVPSLTAVLAGDWSRLESIEITRCSRLTGVYSSAALGSLKTLRLAGVGIQDFTTMPRMPELEHFVARRVTGLRSLAGLGDSTALKSIRISECSALSDLGAMRHMTSASELAIVDCKSVEDLEPLSAMVGLRELDLRGCTAIRSVSPISKLTRLERLSLAGCWFALSCQGLDFIADIEFPRPL